MKFRAHFGLKSMNGRPQWPDSQCIAERAIILFMYLIEYNPLIARKLSRNIQARYNISIIGLHSFFRNLLVSLTFATQFAASAKEAVLLAPGSFRKKHRICQ
jgi:hypothetical protein